MGALNVVITGASGYLGQALVEAVATAGHRGTARRPPSPSALSPRSSRRRPLRVPSDAVLLLFRSAPPSSPSVCDSHSSLEPYMPLLYSVCSSSTTNSAR